MILPKSNPLGSHHLHDTFGALAVLGSAVELTQSRLKEIDPSQASLQICDLLQESYARMHALLEASAQKSLEMKDH